MKNSELYIWSRGLRPYMIFSFFDAPPRAAINFGEESKSVLTYYLCEERKSNI